MWYGNAEVYLLDNIFKEGKGGPGGIGVWYGKDGNDGLPFTAGYGVKVHHFSGTAHSMSMPLKARENEQITLSFHGEPGDHLALLVSTHGGFNFYPGFRGVLMMSTWPFPLFLGLGTLSPSGTHSLKLTLPEQGPAFEAITVYFQALFHDGAKTTTLGNPCSFVLLDQTY